MGKTSKYKYFMLKKYENWVSVQVFLSGLKLINHFLVLVPPPSCNPFLDWKPDVSLFVHRVYNLHFEVLCFFHKMS